MDRRLPLLRFVAIVSLLGATAVTAANGKQRRETTGIHLGARPLPVTHFCIARAKLNKFTVLCPTLYPSTANSQVAPTGHSLLGPSFYWASFNDPSGFDRADDGHVVFGGQRAPFSLVGSTGQTWPLPGQPAPARQLGLPRLVTTPLNGGGTSIDVRPARILRRAAIRGRDALVLVASPFPDGGFMGGHLIILWNRRRHGYMLSFHFAAAPGGRAYTLTERLTAALTVARGFVPIG
jgi:hypothetical protein